MYMTVWGKKIWYEVYGAEHDDTLLYLHGGPGASCLDFVDQAKALSKKMKAVIFDQLGVLRSGKYDPACTKAQIQYIMDHGQNVTQAVFENSGHFPRLEEAGAYTDTVLRFLGHA